MSAKGVLEDLESRNAQFAQEHKSAWIDLAQHKADMLAARESASAELKFSIKSEFAPVEMALAKLKSDISILSNQRADLTASVEAARNEVQRLKQGSQLCFLSAKEGDWVVIGTDGDQSVWRSGTEEISRLSQKLEARKQENAKLRQQLQQATIDYHQWASEYAHRRKSEIEKTLADTLSS